MEEQAPQKIDLDNDFAKATNDAVLQISKWTRLIAMIGFSIGGFIVMLMLTNGVQLLQQFAAVSPIKVSNIYGLFVAGFLIAFFIAALVLFFLYRASQTLIQGVRQSNADDIAQGFNYLKKFFITIALLAGIRLLMNFINLF